MKLAKLLLLVPAFIMAGCKGSTVPSEQKDATTITEAEFNAIVHEDKLFREDNVTFVAQFPTWSAKTEADKGDVKITLERGGDEDVYYTILLEDGSYKFLDYYDGQYHAEHKHASDREVFLFEISAFVPFEFKDLVRNEKDKTYEIKETQICVDEDDEEYMIFENVVFAFQDGKPTSIKFDYYFPGEQDEAEHVNQTFTYGNAKVTIPEYVED